uniref:hypothetical protein n=1 Tax=Myroides odoratimimus TaxID=76832 RepID=UPI00056AC36D
QDDFDIKKTNIATIFYGMLNRSFQNEKFCVLNKDGDEIYNYNLNNNFKGDPMEVNALFNYFLGLQKVEQFFKIRFRNIKIKDIDYRKLKSVLDYIDDKETAYKAEDINVGKLDRKTIVNLVSVPNEPIYSFGWMDKEDTVVIFHEQKFNLGVKNYIIKDAYIVNRQELMESSTEELIVRSSTDQLYSFFTKK